MVRVVGKFNVRSSAMAAAARSNPELENELGYRDFWVCEIGMGEGYLWVEFYGQGARNQNEIGRFF